MFGPLLIFLSAAGAWYLAHHSPAKKTWTGPDRIVAACLFVLPVLCAAFLSLQFFLLLAPHGTCLDFNGCRYLMDFKLEAFQPEYCMGLPPETRSHTPWLIEPPVLQGWVQLILPIAVALLLGRAWRAWTSKSVAH